MLMLNLIKTMMNKLVNLPVHLVHQQAVILSNQILYKVKRKCLKKKKKTKKKKGIKLNKNKL